MARPEATDAVERIVHIAAPPETVYAFLTDPEKLVRWKGVSAELDARPGGIYRVDVRAATSPAASSWKRRRTHVWCSPGAGKVPTARFHPVPLPSKLR